MESSIAVFLWRRPACERLPTNKTPVRRLQNHCEQEPGVKHTVVIDTGRAAPPAPATSILAEGAIALSVTLSGGALFAS